jgi:hypothetical protein
MPEYLVKMRYYPGDPLEEIRAADLEIIAQKFGMKISHEKIEAREKEQGLLMENTLEKRIEDITQEVIIVSGDREKDFLECIKGLYKKYRCPRTAYSLMGSNAAGQKIAKELMNVYGGW